MNDAKPAPRRPVILVILDGFGHNPSARHNAIAAAHTPQLDALFADNPSTTIHTSGPAVGLPAGQMGNSEVGHMTLGCGGILRQDLVAISEAVADGSFYANPALQSAARRAAESGRPLQLTGLVSDGGVHSHLDHLLALIELARREGARPLVHMICDGRDTPPQSAADFLPPLEAALAAAGGAIASLCGRYWAMDRDRRWDRVELAWRALVRGEGRRADGAAAAIASAYAEGENDEFIKPVLLPGFEPIRGDDELVFFNFRNDRPRELSEALALPDFDGFQRGDAGLASLTSMTRYDPAWDFPVAFEKETPKTTLAEVISRAGIRQLHTAETEKYAHVTFFFNGGAEQPFAGEERKLVPSPDVATYDLQPQMSAPQLGDLLVEALDSRDYGFIVVNFANCDMVGHTGVFEAAVQAVEALDEQVGRVLAAARDNGYSLILTADHGNCEQMFDAESGAAHTQHTTTPVPCVVVDEARWNLVEGAGLSAVAPTILALLGLPQPIEMRGKSLLGGQADAA